MKTVDVPTSITRAQYCALIAATGLKVNDLRNLEFRMDGIYAEVYDRDEKGRLRFDKTRDEAIVNKVFIPVED